MITNFSKIVNESLGSSLSLPAHGLGGARAISLLAAHFALRNTASNSAEKKSSPSEGVAEGGGWGEEFLPARAFGFCRAKRGNHSGFRSKKVRAVFSNCDQTKNPPTAVGGFLVWSGCRESNPGRAHPKGVYYRYTTAREAREGRELYFFASVLMHLAQAKTRRPLGRRVY